MRHLKSGRQLSRNSSHRWALMRNLITALLREEKIQTTDPKAKELRRWVERVITLGKRGDLHARRQVLSIVSTKRWLKNCSTPSARVSKTAPAATRGSSNSGFAMATAAQMALIELVGSESAGAAATGGEKKGRRARRRERQQQKVAPLSIYAENIVVYNSPPLILGFGGLLCVWFGIRRLRACVIIGQIFVKSCKRPSSTLRSVRRER